MRYIESKLSEVDTKKLIELIAKEYCENGRDYQHMGQFVRKLLMEEGLLC